MNLREHFETQEQLYHIYTGILCNNPVFADGPVPIFRYEFDCPEYEQLKEQYHLSKIAGKGTDFERARRLCHHFSPRLKHKGDYDGHIEPNALALLDYCYEKENIGINCLYKSKILAECCMALGIYARRVYIMPYSPYDCDNHVDIEIFDCKQNKWILLDVTNDCYYIDENGTGLDMLELRNKLMKQEICSCVFWKQVQNTDKLIHNIKNIYLNTYTAKNMFWFKIDEYSSFGTKGKQYCFLPEHFNAEVRLKHYQDFIYKQMGLDEAAQKERRKNVPIADYQPHSIYHVWDSPIE